MPTIATQATTIWSLATVKTFLNVTDTTQDQILTWIADGVSRLLEREGRQLFVTRTLTQRFDGRAQRVLFLPEYPVVSVASVQVKYYAYDVWTAILPTDYDVDGSTGRVFLKQWWFPRGFQAIQIVYDAGYGIQDSGFPAASDSNGVRLHEGKADVYELGLEMVKYVYQLKANGAMTANVTLGPASFIVRPAWPMHVQMQLANLPRPRI